MDNFLHIYWLRDLHTNLYQPNTMKRINAKNHQQNYLQGNFKHIYLYHFLHKFLASIRLHKIYYDQRHNESQDKCVGINCLNYLDHHKHIKFLSKHPCIFFSLDQQSFQVGIDPCKALLYFLQNAWLMGMDNNIPSYIHNSQEPTGILLRIFRLNYQQTMY